MKFFFSDAFRPSDHQVCWTSSLPNLPSADGDLYQQYLDLQKRIQQLKHEQERKKSEQMYQAWKLAEQANKVDDSSDRRSAIAGGVAVVKTLARQVHRERECDKMMDPLAQMEIQAQDLLKRAALDARHPQALVVLGNTHLQKGEVPRALELWKMANTPEGWFNVGHLLWTGYDGSDNDDVTIEADPKAAMNAFERAVALGDPDALYFVGVQRLSTLDEFSEAAGGSTLDHLQKGLHYIEQAANMGHGGALHYLALLHLNGNEVLGIPPCSAPEFVQRLDQAAVAGDAEALFLRGHCFYHGDSGYPRSVIQALDNFLQASAAGHADAAVSAGAILHKGYPPEGLARDPKRSFELYQHAGELGSLDGWRNVVACYVAGDGVPQSLETAKYITQTMLKSEDK